jgi:hypothetical protein
MTNPGNIGPRGIHRRATLGAIALAAAGALLLALIAVGAPVAWTAACGVLFWLGGLGIFQARAKT